MVGQLEYVLALGLDLGLDAMEDMSSATKRENRVVNMACGPRKKTSLIVPLMSAWIPYIAMRSQFVVAVLSRYFTFETNVTC